MTCHRAQLNLFKSSYSKMDRASKTKCLLFSLQILIVFNLGLRPCGAAASKAR